MFQMQGAQALRNEAYLSIRRNDEGRSATPQVDVIRSRYAFFPYSGSIFTSAVTTNPGMVVNKIQ